MRAWLRAEPVRVLPAGAALLLVAVQIAYPLTDGAARDAVTCAVVGLSALTALLHAWITRGFAWAASFFVIVSGLGFVAEVVGTRTGVPFGAYSYAVGRLGPAIADVPLVVPLAWTGGLYPIWIVAGLVSTGPLRRVALFAVSAVGWDLFLDPQMVADGQWTWADQSHGLPGLPEIPLTNYVGWALVATVMGVGLTLLDRFGPRPRTVAVTARPPQLDVPVTGDHARRNGIGASMSPTAPPRSEPGPGEIDAGAPNDPIDQGGTAAHLALARPRSNSGPFADDAVPVAVLLWTWLGSTLAHAVFLGLPASAVWGFVGMAPIGGALVYRLRERARRGPQTAG
ncbi:hypothetical protein GCM10011591_42840 [Nocardia camponoti]|uniref:Carotenoid biosynthesis protein n=1 Tax=Nocardia camponoti TaxID=1616106 RepID=A0A917QST4_9NOCA|nr:hypothetical protein GCM10011591_42840 [Nocardia camponoti]